MKSVVVYMSALFLLSSCATYVISQNIREQAVTDVPFRVAKENIENYKGKVFIWGGFIASNRATEEGTFLEVVQNPIDKYGSIVDTDTSQGRFLAFTEKGLDPLIYEKGRLVTVAGELAGSKTITRKKRKITYPVLNIMQIYLWREQDIVYYPDYFYYDRYPYWWYPERSFWPYYYPWPYY